MPPGLALLLPTFEAVNLNVRPGHYYESYDSYLEENPIPAAQLTDWWQDAPSLDALEVTDGWCDERIPVALIGEHGPVNMDHLSTITAAFQSACAKPQV